MALRDAVVRKVIELGDEAAAEYFSVSKLLINQWRHGSKTPSLAAVEKVFAENPPADAKVVEANWAGKKVVLLLPWYRSVSPQTAFSIFGILDRAKMGVLMQWGDAFISHTRNKLAIDFLKTGVEWSLSIDDDVILPIGIAEWFNNMTGFGFPDKFAGLHALNRLLSHNKTIVGGLYFGKAATGKPMYAEATQNDAEAAYARKAPYDVCKPTRWVATGCLLVNRKVFLDIDLKYPDLKGHYYSPSEHDLVAASKLALSVLNDDTVSPEARVKKSREIMTRGSNLADHNSNTGSGEDVVFCHRAAQAGHQPHIDMGLVCGHIGSLVYGPRNTTRY